MKLRGGLALGLIAAALGCGGPDYQPVTVTVRAPNAKGEVVPMEGAELTLLPFDIDSLYKALESKNQAGPEPKPGGLTDLFVTFSQADTLLPHADSLVLARQDSTEKIKDRTSDAYREAFRAYQEAQKARDSLAGVRDSLEKRLSAAREAYNNARETWESSAWDGFDAAQEKLYANAPVPHDSAGEDATWKQKAGADGTFKLWVAPGKWWWAGRVGVPGSTHEVYRWNVPFIVDGEPVQVQLTGDQAKRMEAF
jgi:hypothetical protein